MYQMPRFPSLFCCFLCDCKSNRLALNNDLIPICPTCADLERIVGSLLHTEWPMSDQETFENEMILAGTGKDLVELSGLV